MVIMGQSPPSSAYNTEGEGLPFFQGKAEFGPVHPTPVKWCSAPTKVAEPDDVLMSVRAPVGPTNLATERCCIGRGLAAIRAEPGVRSKWLLYAFRAMERCIDDLGTGTTFKAISGEKLRQLEVPIAGLEDQDRAIAAIEKQFSRLDEAVANLKRVRANLDRYLAATLGEAFSGEWAGTEADWRPVPLREVADVQLGQQRAPVHAADVNPIPYVRAANVTWQGLDLSDVKSMGFPNPARYRLAHGDILLGEASGSANEVGKPAIWRDEIPGACYQKTLVRVRCRPDLLNHEFAYYFFLHTALSGQFARLAPGVGILHLTAERMHVWPTAAPPLAVQASVVAEVDRRLSIVREVEAEVDANLKRAQALRQAVLGRAFAPPPVSHPNPDAGNYSL